MTPDQYELISASTEQLERTWTLTRAEIRKRRIALLGRTRPIREPWVRAVGAWGGVRTAAEVGMRVGRTTREVRDYARGMGLRLRTKTYSATHVELAVRLWCDRARPVRESCTSFGVLPVERYLLCAHLEDLMTCDGVGIAEILGGTVGDLEKAWARLGDPFVRGRTPREQLYEEVGALMAWDEE